MYTHILIMESFLLNNMSFQFILYVLFMSIPSFQ